MRPRDPIAAIRDALFAAEWLQVRLAGVTYERLEADETLAAAMERKFEIIGEALTRAERIDGSLAEAVPDLRRIIGLRNVLAHGYDVIDKHEIYLIATNELPVLIGSLRALVGADDAG